MSSVILELRQADATNVVANGDYECLLAKPIVINENDVVQMKLAFVDSVKTTENNIIIENDLNLQLINGIYITDWLVTDDKQGYTANDGSPVDGYRGQDFVPHKLVSDTVDPSLELVTGYLYFYLIEESIQPAFTITYQYYDINMMPQTLQTTFPAHELEDQGNYTDYFNIVCKIGSFQILSPTMDEFAKMDISPLEVFISPNPVMFSTYEPYLFTNNIIIPAGSYSPTNLSLLVSEKLSLNNVSNQKNFTGLVDSPYLKVSSNFDAGAPSPDGLPPTTLTESAIFVASDLTSVFSFVAGKKYYIGSSEMALEYNVDSNNFSFTFLHQPMLDDTGTDISVRYLPYPDSQIDAPQTNMAIAKNGGVFFTSLSATTVKDNTPFDFFGSILGFDVPAMTVNYGPWQDDVLGLTGKVRALNIIDGVTTTNGYYGLNSAVSKNATWYNMQTDITSTIDNTIPIIATTALPELLNTYSHFILDMNMKFNNEFIGKDVNYNVQSIISRYYNFGSYAFGDVDGSVQYVHKGAPIYLKSIRSRILNSSKEIDKSLGDDNTIYMQIIRSGMPIVAKK